MSFAFLHYFVNGIRKQQKLLHYWLEVNEIFLAILLGKETLYF